MDVDEEAIPQFHNVRSTLQRARAALLPPIPHEIDEVVIEGDWCNTWTGHRFLSHQDNDWGILIFATENNYRRLARCDTIYIDGTFKTAPHPYVQFVSIHGKYMGRVLPLVMSLSTGRTIGHYREILQTVKMNIRRVTGHIFSPTMVISDFENSLLIAVQTELRNARVKGCYFHFCQSLWRKIQNLGLARHYVRHVRVKDD